MGCWSRGGCKATAIVHAAISTRLAIQPSTLQRRMPTNPRLPPPIPPITPRLQVAAQPSYAQFVSHLITKHGIELYLRNPAVFNISPGGAAYGTPACRAATPPPGPAHPSTPPPGPAHPSTAPTCPLP